jgi:hypothetical protein
LVQERSWPSAVASSRGLAGELKIIAALLQQAVIEKILTRLGLQARVPLRASARGQALQAAWAQSTHRRWSGPVLRSAWTSDDRRIPTGSSTLNAS